MISKGVNMGLQVWCFTAVLALGVSAVSAIAQSGTAQEGVIIRPEQQGILTRADGTLEVLEPGVRTYDPATERVDIYKTQIDRVREITGAFMIEDCPADVTLIYSIGDVEAFHRAGAGPDLIAAADGAVAALMADKSVMFDTPLSEVADEMRAHLEANVPGGFRFWHVAIDRGSCGPQPPRIEIRREALELEREAGSLVAGRIIPLPAFEVVLADATRLEIAGAQVGVDIVDKALRYQCFGNSSIDPRFELLEIVNLREALASAQLAELAVALRDLPKRTFARSDQFQQECGIARRGVTFDPEGFTLLTQVNCDDTPDAPECRD